MILESEDAVATEDVAIQEQVVEDEIVLVEESDAVVDLTEAEVKVIEEEIDLRESSPIVSAVKSTMSVDGSVGRAARGRYGKAKFDEEFGFGEDDSSDNRDDMAGGAVGDDIEGDGIEIVPDVDDIEVILDPNESAVSQEAAETQPAGLEARSRPVSEVLESGNTDFRANTSDQVTIAASAIDYTSRAFPPHAELPLKGNLFERRRIKAERNRQLRVARVEALRAEREVVRRNHMDRAAGGHNVAAQPRSRAVLQALWVIIVAAACVAVVIGGALLASFVSRTFF